MNTTELIAKWREEARVLKEKAWYSPLAGEWWRAEALKECAEELEKAWEALRRPIAGREEPKPAK